MTVTSFVGLGGPLRGSVCFSCFCFRGLVNLATYFLSRVLWVLGFQVVLEFRVLHLGVVEPVVIWVFIAECVSSSSVLAVGFRGYGGGRVVLPPYSPQN